MINQPAVDTLLEQLSSEGQPVSRYALCVVVAKRARQILEKQNETETLKEIALACREIASGKVKCVKD